MLQDATGLTTYSYDSMRRIRSITYPGPKTLTYSYDAVGNRAVLQDHDGGLTTYSYDSRKLLSYLLNPQSERTTWQYDALSRPTTMTLGNGAMAEYDYDAAGRATALRNLKADRTVLSVFTYSYDSVGNHTAAYVSQCVSLKVCYAR